MNKVTTINLGGRAFQLEEKAYEALHKYLESARHKLADDPDKDEVMQDFEQAVADKCAPLLDKHKNVITSAEIKKIISSMGEVEAAEETHEKAQTEHGESTPKRLYLLREGAIIGGVCNGLAAYFNIDVTAMRLLFIVLVFATGGFGVVLYLLAMLVLPDATTPEQKAELRGERFSAQDVINKAKQKYADVADSEHWKQVGKQASPSLESLGSITLIVGRFIAAAASIVTMTVGGLMTATWITGMWWLAAGNLHLQDQLHGIPTSMVALAATATYVAVIVPTIMVAWTLLRLARAQKFQRRDKRWFITAATLWFLSLGVMGGIGLSYQSRVNDYEKTHASFTIDGHQICINDNLCGDNGEQMTPLQFEQNYPEIHRFIQ